MKKMGEKKLSFEKIKIVKLSNPLAIVGGSFPTITNIPASVSCTKDIDQINTSHSTKTIPIGNTANFIMKNNNKRILSLDKIKIAKLNNPRTIVGGSFSDIQIITENSLPDNSLNITEESMTSTKTIPIGGSIVHPTDI